MRLSAWLLAQVFPARCIVCDRRGTALCPPCRIDLPHLPARVCPRCATLRISRGVCRGCSHLSPSLSWVRAGFVYEAAARRAVLTLKFRAGRYLAQVMGGLLCEL